MSTNPIVHDERRVKLENLRIEVTRWANERRGIRESDLLTIYERRIHRALDALDLDGHDWREKP